ncbi:MAG: alpha/beta hydrolase-fold protein, partial [Bacteroidota bacterium]
DNEFEPVSEVVDELIRNEEIPKSIFIAVGYGSEEANDAKRNRDYTPTATEGIEDYETGGAANFYQFLVQELLPKIQAKYAIDNDSKATLIGHSYGGLFTVFAMFQNPETNPFDKFIPVATSYWYDSGILFEYEQTFANNYQDLPAKVYTTMGALEGGVMIASFAEMMQILEDRNYPNLVLYHELLKRYGHSRSDYITFEKGLPYVFSK